VNFEISYHWQSSYPPAEADRIFENIERAIVKWGHNSLAEIKEVFKRKPEEQTVVRLEICPTSAKLKGLQVYVLLALTCYRGESKAEFVCFLAPKEILVKKKERICKEAQAEADATKANLSMLEHRF